MSNTIPAPVIEEYRGVRGFVVAELLSDTAEGLEYDDIFAVAGISGLNKATESNSEAHYYDNRAAIVITSVGADTVTCNVSAIPLNVLAKITGQYYDAETKTLVEGSPKQPYFAAGYITENSAGEEVYVWRHKVRFAIPAAQHNTKDNSASANGQQLVMTGIDTNYKFTKTGKPAKAVAHEHYTNDPITEDAFFAAPQNIDTISALSPAVTALTLSPTSGSVALGSTLTISATVTPTTATVPVVWESMDTSIATVADGVVTPVAAGGVTIKATCGGKTATCSVIVTEE